MSNRLSNKRIYLIGLPSSGKSSLASMLAKHLSFEYLDTDTMIEAVTRLSISEIFRSKGEQYFRDLESLALIEASKIDSAVIATGGGIVLRDSNIHAMQKTGITIFIDRIASTILPHIDRSNRPLMQSANDILSISKERDNMYRNAATFIFKQDRWENSIEDLFTSFYNFFIKLA